MFFTKYISTKKVIVVIGKKRPMALHIKYSSGFYELGCTLICLDKDLTASKCF